MTGLLITRDLQAPVINNLDDRPESTLVQLGCRRGGKCPVAEEDGAVVMTDSAGGLASPVSVAIDWRSSTHN